MIAHEKHLSLSFYLPPSVGLLLTVWTRFSVRVIAYERHLSLSFYLPPSVGLLLTIWTRFFVRVIAHERHLSLSLYLPPSVGSLEQLWERDHARATRASLLAGILPELRMSALCALHLKRVCFCGFFLCVCVCGCVFFSRFLFFFFRHLSVQTLHMYKPLCIKRPHVEIVPYCIYMITFMHKPLYIKRPQVKTVPYCIYMITFMHKPLYVKKTSSSNSTVLQLLLSRRNSIVHTPLLLSLFSACLAKHPFSREIRTLRQVTHKLHGYIYS